MNSLKLVNAEMQKLRDRIMVLEELETRGVSQTSTIKSSAPAPAAPVQPRAFSLVNERTGVHSRDWSFIASTPDGGPLQHGEPVKAPSTETILVRGQYGGNVTSIVPATRGVSAERQVTQSSVPLGELHRAYKQADSVRFLRDESPGVGSAVSTVPTKGKLITLLDALMNKR